MNDAGCGISWVTELLSRIADRMQISRTDMLIAAEKIVEQMESEGISIDH